MSVMELSTPAFSLGCTGTPSDWGLKGRKQADSTVMMDLMVVPSADDALPEHMVRLTVGGLKYSYVSLAVLSALPPHLLPATEVPIEVTCFRYVGAGQERQGVPNDTGHANARPARRGVRRGQLDRRRGRVSARRAVPEGRSRP